MAAGVAIARAAGATITDTDGSRHSMSSLATIATAPRLAEPVLVWVTA
jgi:myo-inositol-1(or 4)-monophosphatase